MFTVSGVDRSRDHAGCRFDMETDLFGGYDERPEPAFRNEGTKGKLVAFAPYRRGIIPCKIEEHGAE